MNILVVAGARPNFIKVAPIMRELKRRPEIAPCLVHTGQHYDERMSQLFFDELKIPRPDIELEVGSASHAVQTAEIMKRFEPVVQQQRPDVIVVVGDVNSTVACALTAVKMGVPIAHVEAGLRSFDRTMPEEINRILTDAISHWLFVSERSGLKNLKHEGIPGEKVFFVGNVMIDTLIQHRRTSEQSRILEHLEIESREYAVLTLHRPASVDRPEVLSQIMAAIEEISRKVPVVFPVHPRTRGALKRVPCLASRESGWLDKDAGIRTTEPLGYLDFLKLIAHARFVLTDSGGIQEETTVLGVPCLTVRTSTERPATISEGTNTLVGLDANRIVAEGMKYAEGRQLPQRIPELWDGKAATRIVNQLMANGNPTDVLSVSC